MTRMLFILAGLFVIAMVTISYNHCASIPARVRSIPKEAIWAGSADGGAWIHCQTKDQKNQRYACQIYNDRNGELEANGEFVLQERDSDGINRDVKYNPVSVRPAELKYSGYDGEIILLENRLILVPDGLIEHPLGNGHGKRQTYHLGKEIGQELSY